MKQNMVKYLIIKQNVNLCLSHLILHAVQSTNPKSILKQERRAMIQLAHMHGTGQWAGLFAHLTPPDQLTSIINQRFRSHSGQQHFLRNTYK